jgi:heterogeneous nuclear ribonucleoprotein F/H
MKMRGLPFQVKREDIMFFFNDYKYYADSIKIGKNQDGTKTGEGAVLFESENECKKAFLEKQGSHMGHRWIELYQITFADYQDFDNK